MSRVKITELILRDAHQSMLATRMRTEDMLPIASKLDEVGYFSLEVWGGATFDVPIRYLNQDPWERLRKLKEAIPRTPLQMLERAHNIVAYRIHPDDLVYKFVSLAKKNGCDVFRIFDALNDLRNMKVPIDAVNKVWGHAQGCLSYTISPIHTVDLYVQQFKELEKMGCDSLCIKDMAGMISPKRAFDIIKGCKDSGIKIPIQLHCHCTSGMTGMSYMRAVDAGIDILDTALSPISGGTAQPPTESVVAALAEMKEYDTGLDIHLLLEIRKYFLKIWDKYRHLHRFNTLKMDPEVTTHGVPGGMLSNLIFQLEDQGAGDKYFQVLDEIAHVREELGYPPLVTPSSQVVGVQATMNVLFGRYKVIPKETKDYVKGLYGKPPGEIKPEIYEMVLGPNWKDQLIDGRPADTLEPEFERRRDELDAKGLYNGSDEDAMTYALYPVIGLKFLQKKATPEFTSEELPLPPTHDFSRKMVKSMYNELTPEQLEVFGTEGGLKAGEVPTEFDVEIEGEKYEVKVVPTGTSIVGAAGAAPESVEGGVECTMMGNVVKVKVAEGDEVKEGDVVLVLEAMKMENDIKAPRSGKVARIMVKEGDPAKVGDVLFAIQ